MNSHQIIQWILTDATLENLEDILSAAGSRKKELGTLKPRGVLIFSDTRIGEIDPDSNLPILDHSNMNAGFQYKLSGGQRQYIEQQAGLQCTAEVTILQVWVNPQTGFIQEFELAANVAHTRTKGFVRLWICRDATAFFAMGKKLDEDIAVEKEKKVSERKSTKKSSREMVSEAVTKATAQSLAAKYLTRKTNES